ncbi:MAG TPA: hypothetical protein VJ728_01825 [Candidatus Binataceae bacterium]|nr:hypothetical protein [Candidatus Binataceae bacterium]
MAPTRKARLFTTRMAAGIAATVTALVFALTIRGVLTLRHTGTDWMSQFDVLLHGYWLIAAKVVLYLFLCWLGVWMIRGTEGRERLFMVGWFSAILIPPITMQRADSVGVGAYIGTAGMGIALGAALSLVLRPSPPAEGDKTPA